MHVGLRLLWRVHHGVFSLRQPGFSGSSLLFLPLRPLSFFFSPLVVWALPGPERGRTGREEAGILSRHSNSCLSYSHPRSILFNLILSTCLALCVCRWSLFECIFKGRIYIYTGMLVVCHQHENGRRYDVGCMLNERGYDNELGYDRTTHPDFPASPARLICRVYRVWDQLPAQGHSRVTPCYRGRSNAILEWNSSILFPFVCCLSNDVGRCWDNDRR